MMNNENKNIEIPASPSDETAKEESTKISCKNHKKMIVIIIATLLVVLIGTLGILYAAKIICFHSNCSDATCTTPQTCERCGKTKDEPLGHEWIDADCENPKTCKVCGETEGEPLGHEWIDADCENPKTCKICGETEGKPLGHKWKDATCENPKICELCGKITGSTKAHTYDKSKICTEDAKCEVCGKIIPATGHKWISATCTEPKRCSVCGATEGEALGHTSSYGKCSRCGEEIELQVLMYSDSNLDIYFTGLSKGSLNNACINFYAVNKSSRAWTIQVRDESVNGSMMDFTCSSKVAAGKNINDDMSCSFTDLNEIGVYSLDDIELIDFYLHIYDDNHNDYDTSMISIDFKNRTVGRGTSLANDNHSGENASQNNDTSSNTSESSEYTVQEVCKLLTSTFGERASEDGGRLEFAVGTYSDGGEYIDAHAYFEDEVHGLETILGTLTDYTSLVNQNVDPGDYEGLARDAIKIHDENSKNSNGMCDSIRQAVQNKLGTKYEVMLTIHDTDGTPVYISRDGYEYWDALDELIEERGLLTP